MEKNKKMSSKQFLNDFPSSIQNKSQKSLEEIKKRKLSVSISRKSLSRSFMG